MEDLPRREIVVITGGRDRTPTLRELELLDQLLADLGAREVRHGACPPRRNDRGELIGSTDTLVAGYLEARARVRVSAWPADWTRNGRRAGSLRNRDMLAGRRPGQLLTELPAEAVVAFAGGRGTRDCWIAGYEAGLVVHPIYPVAEPQIWNRHHGKPPGPALYCGRGTPVGNPFRPGTEPAEVTLERYRRWLLEQLERDPRVREYILRLTTRHYAVCSCWPGRCHVEVLIWLWRELTS